MTEVENQGEVRVPLPPDDALQLFTPEGERRWVEGWEPKWLQPSEGALKPGAVFSTQHTGEETIWIVLDVDLQARRVRYLRVTPGSRMGTVEVRCAEANSGTTATVTYRLSALSETGEQVLAEMTPESYADEMRSWEQEIARALT